MDAFWCITLSILVIRWYWKRSRDNNEVDCPPEIEEPTIGPIITQEMIDDDKATRKKMEAERQREKEVAELRKQGYTDEIIAVILPTINNGQ